MAEGDQDQSEQAEEESSTQQPNSSQEVQLPQDGAWRIARLYLNSIGEPSALFTGCSRSLIDCSVKADGKLSKNAASQLTRLLKSPSMLAQVFFAAKTYYLSDLQSRKTIEPADFIFFMQPYDLAAIITIGYSTRRISSVLKEEDWELLADTYQRYADLSMPLGFAIPAIGPTHALMVAAGKFLGWGLFNYKDPEKFKKYRVANKMQKRTFSLEYELSAFGTTHLHIASLIWQNFGFGIKTAEEYFLGLSKTDSQEVDSNSVKFKVARLWLESLLESGGPPSQSLGDDYELEDKRSEKFLETFKSISSEGSQIKWLQKNRKDIGPEKTPELIADYEAMNKVIRKRGREAQEQEDDE